MGLSEKGSCCSRWMSKLLVAMLAVFRNRIFMLAARVGIFLLLDIEGLPCRKI